jgi:hypothetical protein
MTGAPRRRPGRPPPSTPGHSTEAEGRQERGDAAQGRGVGGVAAKTAIIGGVA